MPVDLNVTANEKSTLIITVSFKDETKAAVTPNAGLTWTLTDQGGAIINSRSQVPITPASTVTIVLHGNDLICMDDGQLVLTIEGTYDSSLGSRLEIKEQAMFRVADLVAV
jgi:hypothetical protein